MKELLKISLPQLEVDLVSPVEKLRRVDTFSGNKE